MKRIFALIVVFAVAVTSAEAAGRKIKTIGGKGQTRIQSVRLEAKLPLTGLTRLPR